LTSVKVVVGKVEAEYDSMAGEWEKGYIGLYSNKNQSTDIYKVDHNDQYRIVYHTTLPG
jgi:hypothetical protein